MSHPLVRELRDPDAVVRARACRRAADDPSASLLAEAVTAALDDRSRAVRRAAADALFRIARADAVVADGLLRELRSGGGPASSAGRWALLDVARRLSPPEPGWLPAITLALAEAPNELRWTAARLLVDLAHRSPETRGVAEGLARNDERPRVRRMALLCAAQIEPDAPGTRALLEAARRDRDPEVRRAAELALAGQAAAPLQKTSASSE